MTTATLTYYITRYDVSGIDGGTRRVFLTTKGDWHPNRDYAIPFKNKTLANHKAAELATSEQAVFVDGFREEHDTWAENAMNERTDAQEPNY